MLKQMNLYEFEHQIKEMNKPILLKFTAVWCPGCRQLAPIVENVEEQLRDTVAFFDVDVDKSLDLAQKFGVMSIPTLILFKNGKEVDRVTAPDANEEAIIKFVTKS
ncbi:MAG TPA: thioredoxin family protein [Bacillus sp. (in: firmicutes)]|uniref:thioredoxin family protein n=1 Tax=Bacillus litorisediminis TaxID=2922713 RepID=UPI001FABA8F0|nr:thioredoxin family protein [Bacillus litorisediminis]HWO74347.1 thioredoxin family protein [Bacillus sp. (in: firmicutes)]